MEKNWVCLVCGSTAAGADKPVTCPVCGAGREAFTADAPAVVETPAAQAPAAQTDAPAAARVWTCSICGWKCESADCPERCPVCGADREAFTAEAPAVVETPAAQAPAAQTDAPAAARVWTCSICGWKCESADCPERCPVCGAGREAFTADAPVAVETPAAQAPVTKTDTPAAKKRWRCTICNMVFEGEVPPDPCPVCGAGAAAFVEEADEAQAPRKDTDEAFVIIGCGAAGCEAARTIRNHNAGASITLLCGEGELPYNRPALSDVLAGEMTFDQALLDSEEGFAAANIKIIFDRAAAVDREQRRVVLDGGGELPYDKLLLATGANAFCPIPQKEGGLPVRTLRTKADAMELDRLIGAAGTAAVLGGGILGIEAALAIRARGLEVTVIERSDRILSIQGDQAASQRLRAHLEGLGVRVLVNSGVEDTDGGAIILQGGARLEADFLLVCTGVRSELSIARACGLDVNRGVIVDQTMRTSDPHIYAAGDCAEFGGKVAGLWSAALAQGRTAGLAMAGAAAAYAPIVPATALEDGAFKLFSAGTVGGGAHKRILLDDPASNVYKALYFDGDKLCGAVFLTDVSGAAAAMDAIEKAMARDMAMLLLL